MIGKGCLFVVGVCIFVLVLPYIVKFFFYAAALLGLLGC